MKTQLSIGKVISFTMITSKFLAPLLSITKQWDQFIQMKGVLARLNDIFLSPSENSRRLITDSTSSHKTLRGEIEFKDVWFRYGGESSEWVLKGINFKIEAGQKVAIVGPSGSGKSTMAHLLTRMYDPTKGTILIDGKDYRQYDIAWLRQQLAILHQESSLFTGTIAENIAINSLESNESEIYLSARKAAAIDFIQSKPYGFNSYVPHGGLGYSGGEKQKIAIARLFFQKPSVVILDEATSALDGISEDEVLKHLLVELQTHTVVNIAHRFTTVAKSEFALVLNDGRICGFDTLEQLSKNNTIFKKLFGTAALIDSRLRVS